MSVISSVERLQRKRRLRIISQIADVNDLEPPRLDEMLRIDGVAGSYPTKLREAWARGEITNKQWLEGLDQWAKALVAAEKEAHRAET